MGTWINGFLPSNSLISDVPMASRPANLGHAFHKRKLDSFSTSSIEVIRPWEQMNHCVAGYVDRVEAGPIAFYRVMKPERATAALQKRGDCWTLSEVHGPSNREISHDASSAVAAWHDEDAYETYDEDAPALADDCQQAFAFEETPF